MVSYILPHPVASLGFMDEVIQNSVASSEIASSVPDILHKCLLFCYYLLNGRLLLYFACINAKPFTSPLLSQTLGSGVLKNVFKVTPVGQRRNCTCLTAYKTHPLFMLRYMLA